MPSAYCGECEWEHRVDDDEQGELSRAMIDHFVETGHSPVERRDAEERLEKRGDGAVEASSDEAESKAEPNPRRE